MPIYEYRCDVCRQKVEVLVRSSAAQATCPDCGNKLSHKLFSVPNVLSGQTRRPASQTCCGQEEHCDAPPCSHGGGCCHN